MEILSWQFGIFVFITAVIFYLLPTKVKNPWLLLTSYVFYATLNLKFLAVLIAISVFTYFIGKTLNGQDRRSRLFLWAGILADILLLILFKLGDSGYLLRLGQFLMRSSGASTSLNFHILLPVGLSFYVLQSISYLIDIYRRQSPPSDNFINFALYLGYFPKLTAGPIERWRSFSQKINKVNLITEDTLSASFALILIGLIRKVVIAAILAQTLPDKLFFHPEEFGRFDLIIGLLLYAFWLYNDFAGYTDIARGISLLFGIPLAKNFQSPFLATGFSDFWNRWHISLSHWLRDYIFFPLQRFFSSKPRTRNTWIAIFIPPLITFSLSGLWHNPAGYMITWGVLHGLYLGIERFFSLRLSGKTTSKTGKLGSILQILFIFTVTTLTWIPFASGSLTRAKEYALMLLTSPMVNQIIPFTLMIPLLWMIISLWIDWRQEHHKDELFFLKWNIKHQALLLALTSMAIFFTILWGETDLVHFIYQGF